MAITTRYFSTVPAGTGDGSSWANRAILCDTVKNVTVSAWSAAFTIGETATQAVSGATGLVGYGPGSGTVFSLYGITGSPNTTGIWTGGTSLSTTTPNTSAPAAGWCGYLTQFAFNSTDSLLALIGPGTHTYAATLQASSFPNAPSVANPLIAHGCNSSGNALTPPSAGWTADQPVWDDSGYPVIASTGNFGINLPNSVLRHVKITASGRNAAVFAPSSGNFWMDWVTLYQSTSNANAIGITLSTNKITNVYIYMSGTAYQCGLNNDTGGNYINNLRVRGNLSASSGNRNGIEKGGTSGHDAFSRMCLFNHVGIGFSVVDTNTAMSYSISRSVIVNNTGDGIKGASTASQTLQLVLDRCFVTGNGGYQLNFQAAGNVVLANSRLDTRGGGSGNINTSLLNYPVNLDVYTTADTDANEYVDATSTFDFRIKNSASNVWGKGYGVSDQAAAAGGGGLVSEGHVG